MHRLYKNSVPIRFGIAPEFTTVLIAKLTLIITFLVSLFIVSQTTTANPFLLLSTETQTIQVDSEPEYQFSIGKNHQVLNFQGYIDFGATEDLRVQLTQYPAIRAIVLNSNGGSVYEARGMAKVITQHQLVTYTTRGCSSACLTAFMGGEKRWLGENASLGFHQYRLEVATLLPGFNIKDEFEKDFAYFRTRGIDLSYIKQAYQTQHQDIWYPDNKTLLAANIIHGISEPDHLLKQIVLRDVHL